MKKKLEKIVDSGVEFAKSSANETISEAKTVFKLYAYCGLAIVLLIIFLLAYGIFELIF